MPRFRRLAEAWWARGSDSRAALSERYRRFGQDQAAEWSPIYRALCNDIAGSAPALDFLSALPREKQQPNLFLAALRVTGPLPQGGAALEARLLADSAAIRAIMMARRTQTNEPGRCAVLHPALALLPGPLAILEVGASAGLCLIPDRYGYRYGAATIRPEAPVVFDCAVTGPAPVERSLPRIVWRKGLDLNPLDPAVAEDAAWLEALVWPEQADRLTRLRQALALASADPAPVVRGDLLRDVEAAFAGAPPGATRVVFHTAVLAYVDPADRPGFRAAVGRSGAHWISNEAPPVFPDLAAAAPPAPGPDWFLLALNGRPLAWTRPHGQAIHWFGPAHQAG